eukprot:697116-Rhodomonas_salina.1
MGLCYAMCGTKMGRCYAKVGLKEDAHAMCGTEGGGRQVGSKDDDVQAHDRQVHVHQGTLRALRVASLVTALVRLSFILGPSPTSLPHTA